MSTTVFCFSAFDGEELYVPRESFSAIPSSHNHLREDTPGPSPYDSASGLSAFTGDEQQRLWGLSKGEVMRAISGSPSLVDAGWTAYDLLVSVEAFSGAVAVEAGHSSERSAAEDAADTLRPWDAWIAGASVGDLLSGAAAMAGCEMPDADGLVSDVRKSDAFKGARANGPMLFGSDHRSVTMHAMRPSSTPEAGQSPNASQAPSFALRLLVLMRPVSCGFHPGMALNHEPHAPASATRDKFSSSVVQPIIAKLLRAARRGTDTSEAPPDGPTPLPKSALGVVECLVRYRDMLFDELEVLACDLQDEAQWALEGRTPDAQEAAEAREVAALQSMLARHLDESVRTLAGITGSRPSDALFALLHTAGDLDAAASRLFDAPPPTDRVVTLQWIRRCALQFLDPAEVARVTAPPPPVPSAVRLPLGQCRQELLQRGHPAGEVSAVLRGVGGDMRRAADYFSGNPAARRMVQATSAEVGWFDLIRAAVRDGHATVADVRAVLEATRGDPQGILAAWHSPLQATVRVLCNVFVQHLRLVHERQALAQPRPSVPAPPNVNTSNTGHALPMLRQSRPPYSNTNSAPPQGAGGRAVAGMPPRHRPPPGA